MKVALDVRPALSRPTGVGAYIGNLAERLPRLDPDSHYTLFSSSWRERWTRPVRRPNVGVVDRRLPVRLLNVAWNRLGWPPMESVCGREFDLVHSPHPLIIPTRRARRVITVHDLFFLKHPEMTSAEIRRDYAPLVRAHAVRADFILCPSAFTGAEVERLLGVPRSRIGVTPLGVDPIYRQPPAIDVEALLARLGVPRGSILYVGSDEPRKNLPGLVAGYRRFASAAERPKALVLVGPDPAHAGGDAASGGRVLSTGYLATPEIRALMSAASCLALVSLEEGFGLPVAEAMAAGLPVVCTRGSSLAEIAGDAAEFVDDPGDAEAVARALARVTGDAPHAARLREAGLAQSRLFDWERTTSLTLGFYRKVLRG